MLKSDEASSRNQIITTARIGQSTFMSGLKGAAVTALVMSSTTTFRSQISMSGKILRRTDITIFVNVHPGELFQTSFKDSLNNLIFGFIHILLLIVLLNPIPWLPTLQPLIWGALKSILLVNPPNGEEGGYLIFFHKINPITLILLTK